MDTLDRESASKHWSWRRNISLPSCQRL